MSRTRRTVTLLLAGAATLSGIAVLGPGLHAAGAGVSLGVANGTVNAAVDHTAVGTGVFPNFKSGAIDSYLPLGHAHVDNSPFAEGTASPLDTGPVGQTAAGAGSRSQPQYAEARFPKAENTTDTVGSPGGPYAHAAAVQGSASATATYAGGASPAAPGSATVASPSDREATLAALDAALRAWGARFLSPVAALHFPAAHPDAAEPDGASGGTVTASVALDPAAGLVDSGDSRVGSASFGGGAVLIRNVHVSVSVTNGGTPHATSAVDLGQVSVGGAPVTVGSGGVSVGPGAGVPLDQLQAASEQLNAALAKGGLVLRAVGPTITTSGSQETVDASGIQVGVQQPPTAPGVPTQFVSHTVGEVFADSLAVQMAPVVDQLPLLPVAPPSAVSAGSDSGSLGGTTGTAGTSATAGTTGTPGGTGYPGAGSSSPPRSSAPRTLSPTLIPASVVKEKPLWLLLLYLMWQSLIIGTAVSLWWWRAVGRAAP
jgi:hypothetical protein